MKSQSSKVGLVVVCEMHSQWTGMVFGRPARRVFKRRPNKARGKPCENFEQSEQAWWKVGEEAQLLLELHRTDDFFLKSMNDGRQASTQT